MVVEVAVGAVEFPNLYEPGNRGVFTSLRHATNDEKS
jgi:hypothetical protein